MAGRRHILLVPDNTFRVFCFQNKLHLSRFDLTKVDDDFYLHSVFKEGRFEATLPWFLTMHQDTSVFTPQMFRGRMHAHPWKWFDEFHHSVSSRYIWPTYTCTKCRPSVFGSLETNVMIWTGTGLCRRHCCQVMQNVMQNRHDGSILRTICSCALPTMCQSLHNQICTT